MSMAEPPSTVPALLADLVARRGNHDAIATLDETISYDELDRRSAVMARALLAAGAGKGTRLALLAPDGIFWVTAFLAGLRIGALVTFVSTLCSARELAHMLRHSDVQFLIAARRFLNHDYGEKLETAFPEIANAKPGTLRIADAPFLRAVWIDDAEGLGWAGAHEDLLALADSPGAPDAAMLAAIENQVAPGEDAIIVYTSGSTALPKAVVHSHWNACRHSPHLAKLFLIKPDDRMLPMLPAFWLGGMAMLFQVLTQGATLVYPPSPDLEDVAETLETLKVNRLNGWGDGLARLGELARERGIDVDAIIGFQLFRDTQGKSIPMEEQSGMLGMSESFAPHSAEQLDYRMPDGKKWCCGRSVGGYERRIVDPDSSEELHAGEIGELQLRGGGLMKGFYKKRRSDVFTPDGFYPTGDLCRIDEDDYLYFVARRNDMIKTRSANVSRLEVEAALNTLADVEVAVVAGLPHDEFGQIVAAAVVSAKGATPSEKALRAALRDEISSYKIPRRIVFIDEPEIPRTPTGKLKLHELGDLIAARTSEKETSE
ncbi:MAG: class I adenylate-forming enzyme family protein [Novosphingobium sp.]|nr:class I adenylate-forming enzyme family protein [Novosphingobium sp.]